MKKPFYAFWILIGSTGVLHTQYIPTYEYEFNQKLRDNIDKVILEGVDDTCGVINFFYPIELSSEGYRGSNVLQFQVENDCSKFIDLTKKQKGFFLEIIVTDNYNLLMNLNDVKESDIENASERFFTDYLVNKEGITSLPTISLRVSRECKNKKRVDTILDTIHRGFFTAAKRSVELRKTPLRFHLGKSSRAEPPRIELFGQ
ncbi:MAG: hypothetical protein HKN39_03480 [Flavobacteriales bacterium]|nr:hypothetical protein [Flavobacteriales bacterium]